MLRKRVNYIAVFFFGTAISPLLSHLFQIIIGYAYPPMRGGVMSGIEASFPFNATALFILLVSIGYIAWYWKWGSKKDRDKDKLEENQKTEAIKTAVKDGIKEAIIELKQEGKL